MTDIYIDNRSGRQLSAEYEAIIISAIKGAIEAEEADGVKLPEKTEVSVSIVDNAEIRELNKEYRDVDNETDVLSFPQYDSVSEAAACGDIICPLGDIIISADKAEEQADGYGHSLYREIGFLTVHGMLHLLGYDHMTEEDERLMIEKQDAVLEKMELRR